MIDPRTMSAVQWADAVNLALATQAPTPVLRGPDGWKEWAYVIIAIPSVARFSPPVPDQFSGWQVWAERLVECVPL